MLVNNSIIKNEVIVRLVVLMNLTNIDIEVNHAKLDNPQSYGQNGIDYHFLSSIISIREDLDQEDMLLTLIHELCHLVTMDVVHIADKNLDDIMFDLYTTFDERSNEQYAKIIFKLVRGEFSDGIFDNERVSKSE